MADEFARRVQERAEAHLAACNEAAWHEGAELLDSPAYGPYCGCDTCIVREVLLVCWNEMLAEARREAAGEPAVMRPTDDRPHREHFNDIANGRDA